MIRLKTCLFVPAALALLIASAPIALAQDEATAQTAAPELELLRLFRRVRSGSVAARVPGLQGGVQRLPSPKHSLPRARRWRRARLQRRRVKALAASYQVVNDEPNDKGEIFKRAGAPSDYFPPPESFPNDQAAAAALRQGAARYGVARQGAQIRARLSLVRLRRLAVRPISGNRRRLHLCDPDRLHESRRPAMEPLLPRPQDRHAAADRRRGGRVCGRHAADARSITRRTWRRF